MHPNFNVAVSKQRMLQLRQECNKREGGAPLERRVAMRASTSSPSRCTRLSGATAGAFPPSVMSTAGRENALSSTAPFRCASYSGSSGRAIGMLSGAWGTHCSGLLGFRVFKV